MENPVLESTKEIYENSRFIKVNKKRLEKVAKEFAKESLTIPSWDAPVFLDHDHSLYMVDFFLLANSINFAFTDFKTGIKFETEYQGTNWKGSYGMFACLKRAYDTPLAIFNTDYLANISVKKMKEIFKGNIEIPMLKQRTKIFREIGKVLQKNYCKSLDGIRWASKGMLFNDGRGFVERLVKDFPSFDDSLEYKGKKVCFYKRAQLAPAMLYGKFQNKYKLFNDIDKLTVFADYVLPKALRDLGIFEYTKSLKDKIDNSKLIKANSRTELELRACTIHAADMLIKEINKKRKYKINALHLDYRLWSEARKKPGKHHLTKTIAY